MRHAVIMAGGGGTRLWPASRRRRPKQLLPLGARPGEPLVAATVRRLGDLVPASRTVIVTAADQVPAIADLLPGLPRDNLIGEPVGRNTAAAIGLSALRLLERDPGAVIAALPADQHVADEEGFRAVLARAFALAEAEDAIVTIGIKPTRPETGFGYLELGAPQGDAWEVARFVEKPDRATAEGYLEGGRHLWNGGMFFFSARRILAEIDVHLPALGAGLAEIARGADPAAVYARLPSVSIDYGVMEQTTGILCVPGDFGWSDVGAWSALAEWRPADAAGNVADGLLLAHQARDNVVFADPGVAVALVGVEGLCVVQAGNAVLVVPRNRAQDVREIVRLLEERKLDTYL